MDLIVFFEAVASPIRLVQRMGRTGRKRAGRVVMLVTDGAEHDKLVAGHSTASKLSHVLRQAATTLQLYSASPRMIPTGISLPTIELEDLVIDDFHMSQVGGVTFKKQPNISNNSSSKLNAFVDESKKGSQRSMREFMGAGASLGTRVYPDTYDETVRPDIDVDYGQWKEEELPPHQSVLMQMDNGWNNYRIDDEELANFNYDEYLPQRTVVSDISNDRNSSSQIVQDVENEFIVTVAVAPSEPSCETVLTLDKVSSPHTASITASITASTLEPSILEPLVGGDLEMSSASITDHEDHDYCGDVDGYSNTVYLIQRNYFSANYRNFVAALKGQGTTVDNNIQCMY